MPLRNVAANYTFEQQRQEINLLAADVDSLDTNVTNILGQQSTETIDSPTFRNLTLGELNGATAYLRGPATLTIDPAAFGDNTGTVVIAGNLQVDGVTTTVNSTTMTVDDVSITLASGAANAAAADAAGIDVDGAGATFYYRSAPDAWASNKKLLVNQTSEQASRANLEVTSTKDASFPQYSYGIMATDDAAYNVNPGSGIGFGYKWNASGNYAQAGGIRMIKENTNDNDYAGAMLFYTRPMGDGPLERLRVSSDGKVGINETNPAAELEVGGSVWLKRSSSDQFADQFRARKDRGGQAVQDGDTVLTIMAQGFSSAASSYRDLARIDFEVDGTPQAGFADMPGSVVFKLGRESQSSLQETLRLHSSGQLTLNLPTNTTSRHIGIVNSAGTIGWTFGNGVVASARQFVIYDNEAGAVRLKIDASGTVSDSMGPLRSLGVSTKSSAYQLGLGDVGRMIVQTGNSQSVTIPNGFSAGDMITIINQTATNINLVQGTGLTLYNTADASTGTRTLAQRGASTVVFTDSNTAYISGSGLT